MAEIQPAGHQEGEGTAVLKSTCGELSGDFGCHMTQELCQLQPATKDGHTTACHVDIPMTHFVHSPSYKKACILPFQHRAVWSLYW